MRIGIEAQRIFRKKRFGMDVVALELIKNLQKLDSENEYFIFAKKGENYEDFELNNPNFHLIEINSKSYIDWEQIHLPKVAKSLKLDVLHCTNNTSPIFCDLPIVLTLHDTIFMDKVEIFDLKIPLYQSWGNLYRKMIVSATIKNIKKVVTVSDFERERMIKRFKLSENAIKRIYNGIGEDFKQRRSDDEIAEFKNRIGLGNRYMLFLGNLHPRKNMDRVIEAFAIWKKKSSSEVKLLITNASIECIEKIIHSKHLDLNHSEVIIPGYIGRKDLPNLFAGAELLLYPSIREGFGIPIVEAFSLGTPVITSTLSSMPEVAGDAAVLVDPFSTDEIAVAIESIMSDSELRNELIRKGIERAKEFSWEASAKSYLDVYYEITNNEKPEKMAEDPYCNPCMLKYKG